MDLKTLLALPLTKLREEALKAEGIHGVHGMDKDALVEALAKVNELELPRGQVLSEAGRKLKPLAAKLKARRREQVAKREFAQARLTRRQMRRTLRRMRSL